MARLFGADAATDAFFVAFRIPNALRRLFAEGAFSLALVPVLTEYKEHRARRALTAFVDEAAGTLAAALLLLTAVGILTAPMLVLLFARVSSRTPTSGAWRPRCCGSPSPMSCSSRSRPLPAAS